MFEETASHLFVGCEASAILWRTGPWPIKSGRFADRPIMDWIKFKLSSRNLPLELRDKWQEFILAAFIIMDQYLWYTRNEVVHREAMPPVTEVTGDVRRRYEHHRAAWQCCVSKQTGLLESSTGR